MKFTEALTQFNNGKTIHRRDWNCLLAHSSDIPALKNKFGDHFPPNTTTIADLMANDWEVFGDETIWNITYGSICFYADSVGAIRQSTWRSVDIEMREMGNCFLTKEEAQKEVEYRKAVVKVIKRIAELNEGWIPNWGDPDECKFYIYVYGNNELDVEICLGSKYHPNALYLKSRKLAKQLIREMPHELMLIHGKDV